MKTMKKPAASSLTSSTADASPAPKYSAEIDEAETFNADVEKTATTLLQECSKVRVRFAWFGTSAKIDDEVLGEMMGDAPALIKDAMAAHKRLLKSKDASLVSAKQAFQAIKDYVNSMTIPMIALAAASSDDAGLRKDGGVRLIQKKDMGEFDTRMKYLTGILATAVDRLQQALPAIKAEDKERLDKVNVKLYSDTDYPADVTKLIAVTYGFEPTGVDVDWQKLCPEIYEREGRNARKRFEAVVENAAVEYATQLVKYVQQVVEQLGNRVRLNPVLGKESLTVLAPDDSLIQVNIDGAEVLAVRNHEDDPDEIPAEHVLLQLRLKKTAKGKSSEVWAAEPMARVNYYGKLRPYESSTEKKKLYDSTVENLKATLDAYLNIGDMFGPYKEVVSDGVAKVKAQLTKASSNLDVGAIAQQLREGSYFRNEMKATLEGVATHIAAKIEGAKAKRRSIKKGLIGNV